MDGRSPGVVPYAVPTLAVLAAIAYSSWVAEEALNARLNSARSYVSELFANDQPYSSFFATADLLAGTLAAVVAVMALRRLRRRPAATAGWAGLTLFGTMTAVDATFASMDCAVSLSTHCALLERAGRLSLGHQAHAVTSSLATAGGLVCMFALTLAAIRYGWWPVVRRFGPALCLIQAAVSAIVFVLIFTGGWIGAFQRVQVGIFAFWLLLIAIALRADRRKPYPQELVGDVTLDVRREGAGTPPVILTSGVAGVCADWRGVADLLTAEHKVIMFDRPGIGGSDLPAEPPSLRSETERLAALARTAGAPVIVVAHSMGAFPAEAFTRIFPDLVRGLVLVDPSCESTPPPVHPLVAGFTRALTGALAVTGLPQLLAPPVRRLITTTPIAEVERAYGSRAAVNSIGREFAAYAQMAQDLHELRKNHEMPSVELTVITAGSKISWRRCHAELAKLVPAGRQRIVAEAGHMVHVERPDLVAAAVREMAGS
ncbi:alpha/beta fold hydrolase [Rhizohabitans arisaemae]|uniref:alpha/beta fold hydrolase n=1 Tax=Rhizohabitans arisaemae TaxID=2720610 RepID=UPI0024B27E03|nr:alpha/beta fold hydrolase [Rhizohabitans arisaemae]